MHCYCDYNYFSLTSIDADVRSRCSSWINDYVIYEGIPILISLGIVIYDLIVDRIFKMLSKF